MKEISKERLFYSALNQITELMKEGHVTNSKLNKIAKSLGLSKGEVQELKELYKKMHRLLHERSSNEVTAEEKLKIIEEILYPSTEKKDISAETNLQKAKEDVERLDSYSLSLKSIKKRISLRNNLITSDELKLERFIKETLKKREDEKIDIDFFCQEVISEYSKNPQSICSFIEKKAIKSEIDPKELKKLLVRKLINLKQEI